MIADFEDRYIFLRTTIEGLAITQGKSPTRLAEAPVVDESSTMMVWEQSQENYELPNHEQPSHPMENFKYTILEPSEPHPKHFQGFQPTTILPDPTSELNS